MTSLMNNRQVLFLKDRAVTGLLTDPLATKEVMVALGHWYHLHKYDSSFKIFLRRRGGLAWEPQHHVCQDTGNHILSVKQLRLKLT